MPGAVFASLILHTSAKPSGHWGTGREFCALDPIFKLVVVLNSCGYGPSYWGAVKVFAGYLERREPVFYFCLLERSRSEAAETGKFGLGKSFRRVLVLSNSLSPSKASTRGWGPINAICSRSM